MAFPHSLFSRVVLAAGIAGLAPAAFADEAAIRKTIAERMPDFPKIDEISKTPIPGVYEIRLGAEIFYSDEHGHYMFQGHLVDTKTRRSLTEARISKLTAIDFASLPLKDAIVWKQGNGERKMAVFADPNCGYCKTFERDLRQVKNVTVYTFLYPILGGDSPDKSRDIWCSRDNTKAWRDWMLDGAHPVRAMGPCDAAALQRNTAFGRKHKINGTPAVLFEDGQRVPGALSVEQIEKQLVASRKPS